GTLLASYLAAAAEIVVLAEALSAFHAVGRAGFLLGEAVLLGGAAWVWLRRGRPVPARPELSRRALRRHPVVAGLGLVVVAAIVFEAVVGVIAPPNNWDSMTYHLSRAAAWYQSGAVEYHPAASARENVFPPNAEIQILYSLVFLGRDTLAALPQLVAQLALLVGIFGIGRRLGFDRPAALFGALLFATLSQVALQSTTTQNDLVVTAAVVAAAYFILGRSRVDLALAGLAVGLALGTKLTAVFALPVLALLALATLPRRRLVALAAAAAVSFAALGSWVYAANVIHTGHPLGNSPEVEQNAAVLTVPGTFSTGARVLWRFVDLSGWDADVRVLMTLHDAGRFVFDGLGIDQAARESTLTPFFLIPNTRAHEDISFFGPLGALLVVPLGAAFLLGGALRRVPRERWVLALALPLFLAELALVYRYNEWVGRFMLIPVALTLPLAAWLYRWRVVAAGAAAVGALFLPLTELHNRAKPVPASFAMSRPEAQSKSRPDMAAALQLVARAVPEDAAVGYSLHPDGYVYPLYGERLARRLVRLSAARALEDARRRGLEWAVVDRTAVNRAPGWQGVWANGWTVLARAGSPAARRLTSAAAELEGRRVSGATLTFAKVDPL
ncbi:MAG: glycosyltransferase 87 family protein, partial [Gaiellaceae bacterium]